jgi:hypothetical protein
MGFKRGYTPASRMTPAPRGGGGPAKPYEALYVGRAEIVVDSSRCGTCHIEAFCLFLREKHGVKARPGDVPRFSKAWPQERVQAIYEEWCDS